MNIFDYVATNLTPAALDRLYENPWTCQAVIRSLSPLAKQYAVRLLCVESAVDKALVDQWARADATSQAKHRSAIDRLTGLRVLLAMSRDKKSAGVQKSTMKAVPSTQFILNPVFQKQLLGCLCEPQQLPFPLKGKGEKQRMSISDLDKFAQDQWESILHFLVGSTGPTGKVPSAGIVELLVTTGLMVQTGDDSFQITNDGFQFLLKDIFTQVWTFLLEYINTAEDRGISKDEILGLLFRLSFLSLGQEYGTEKLSPAQLSLLQDLRELGLIYQRKPSSTRFTPTRLAVNLSAGMGSADINVSSALHLGREDSGDKSTFGVTQQQYIIVESNFRLYAYSRSTLQIALLSLFVRMLYRLPNMAVGMITRDSIQQALANGISADQIIDFLQTHAHPVMSSALDVSSSGDGQQPAKRTARCGVPETVCDQIRLWEAEKNRASFKSAVLYEQFMSIEEFKECEAQAKALGVLLWSDLTNERMVVDESGHEQMRAFIKSRQ